MKFRSLAMIIFLGAAVSGCHMYGDTQVKPHHHAKVHKVVVHKVHKPAKPSVHHRHPANGYTKDLSHAHPGGGKHHRHNYGKKPMVKPAVHLIKYVTPHANHRHHRKHH